MTPRGDDFLTNMENQQTQIRKVLFLLHRFQIVLASILFLLVAADAFGAGILRNRLLGGALFFICALFLAQTGTMYVFFYRFYLKSPFRKKMKLLLINMTALPIFFVIAASISFFLRPIPAIHQAYALACISFIPLSIFSFRHLISQEFSNANCRK